MTLGFCTICQKWGGHIDSECKWEVDPTGQRRYYCHRCEGRYAAKSGLTICRKRGCGGILMDLGAKKVRKVTL